MTAKANINADILEMQMQLDIISKHLTTLREYIDENMEEKSDAL